MEVRNKGCGKDRKFYKLRIEEEKVSSKLSRPARLVLLTYLSLLVACGSDVAYAESIKVIET